MKAQVQKVCVYKGESVMLIAPQKFMYNFAIHMAVIAGEAYENAMKEERISTANSYEELRKQFHNIAKNIEKED